MPKQMALKAAGVWLLFMVFAVLSGVLRVKLMVPLIGRTAALVLSGLLLAVVIFLITFALLPRLKVSDKQQYWMIGGLWILLTLVFEFPFMHYVIGESWISLFGAYNVTTGNLWALDMLSILFSPSLASKLRRRT